MTTSKHYTGPIRSLNSDQVKSLVHKGKDVMRKAFAAESRQIRHNIDNPLTVLQGLERSDG